MGVQLYGSAIVCKCNCVGVQLCVSSILCGPNSVGVQLEGVIGLLRRHRLIVCITVKAILNCFGPVEQFVPIIGG